MDVENYDHRQSVFHSAQTSGLLAGAITAFITFCVFMLMGFAIAETAAWMFALALMAASGTFVLVYVIGKNTSKQRGMSV